MRYLVTGATGFIGGELVRQLVARGDEVVAIVRSPEKAGDLAAIGVTLARGDVTDKQSMRGPMTGVDGVFHVAGWYKVGVKDTSPGQAINVEGTRNVLTLMQELGIRKGVYTSSVAVNGDTHGRLVDESCHAGPPFLTEYDRTKWEAHVKVALPMMEAGLPLVVVMPGVVYGPGDTSIVRENLIQYLIGKLPLLAGGTTYSWAHIEDIAAAHLLAMDRGTPGESYIIAGETVTLVDAMRLAERLTGIPAPRLVMPPFGLRMAARIAGLIDRMVNVPEAYSAESLRVIAGVTYIGSNAKARREWGYDPRPLEIGLKQTLDHELALLGDRARKPRR
jgi:nucleoside-diphosphate-sugar epimerase